MIPSKPDSGSPTGERKTFRAFRNNLGDDWTVLYARRFVEPARKGRAAVEGEADFLALHRSRGLLVLEVKGGRVGRDGEGWYSIDRNNARHAIKDPGKQAQHNAHTIGRLLRSDRGRRNGTAGIPYTWGVVFPDVDARAGLGISLPREIVLDQADLLEPGAALMRCFTAQGHEPHDLGAATIAAAVDMLAPTLQLLPTLSTRVAEEEREFVRMTQEQFTVLDMLREERRVAIRGVAGSGKTMLAMEKARRLAADGRRVLLLCFNAPLAGYLAAQAEGYTVRTFHGLCRELCAEANIDFDVPSGAQEKRRFFDDRTPELLLDALEALPEHRYDSLVVDEGQDFRGHWWPAVQSLLADDSWFYVFWDPDQDIYGGGPTDDLGLTSLFLETNCRNTERIATFAAACVGRECHVKLGTPEGVEVEEFVVRNDAEAIATVRRSLHELIHDQKLRPDQVVVLSTKTPSASPVFEAGTLGNFRLVELGNDAGSNEVVFSSLHRFKGLEADAVVLCDVANGRSSGPRFMNVGASRAKHVLKVVRHRDP